MADDSLFQYDSDKAILYALAVGEHENIRHLYESEPQFSILPSFAVLPGLKAHIESELHAQWFNSKGLEYDPTRLLHGEQYLELFKPVPIINDGQPLVTSRRIRLLEALDKGTSTTFITECDTCDASGELLFRNQTTAVIAGTGNWGGSRQISNPNVKEIVKTPEEQRPPDRVSEQTTTTHQSIIYRLLGDKNPLHVDRQFAELAGFPGPILHGLCTLGFATRHILENFAPDDGTQLCRRIKARFSGVIYPGETIKTEMWKEGERVHFQCCVRENGKPLITGGYLDLGEPSSFGHPKISVNKL